MNLNNYTIKAQEAIQNTVKITEDHQQLAIEPGHLLLSILQLEEHSIDFLLKKLNVNRSVLTQKLDDLVGSYPKASAAPKASCALQDGLPAASAEAPHASNL